MPPPPFDQPDPAPPDPRHRSVVLYVPPRATHSRRRTARTGVPAAAGTCVLVVALLFGTLVCAWAGWRLAVPDAVSTVAGPLRVPGGPDREPATVRAPVARAPATQDAPPVPVAGREVGPPSDAVLQMAADVNPAADTGTGTPSAAARVLSNPSSRTAPTGPAPSGPPAVAQPRAQAPAHTPAPAPALAPIPVPVPVPVRTISTPPAEVTAPPQIPTTTPGKGPANGRSPRAPEAGAPPPKAPTAAPTTADRPGGSRHGDDRHDNDRRSHHDRGGNADNRTHSGAPASSSPAKPDHENPAKREHASRASQSPPCEPKP